MTWKSLKVPGLVVLLLAAGACGRSSETVSARHLERGKKLLATKDYQRAILEFRNAAKALPKNAENHYQLGVACAAAGDIRGAVAGFKKALELDPNHVGAQLRMAQMMVASRDEDFLKTAEEKLKVLGTAPGASNETLNTLALAELQLGKTETAAGTLEQLLIRSPQEFDASVILASTRLYQGDVKGAESALLKACESSPNSAGPRLVLAKLYSMLGRLPEAETQLRRALELDRANGSALMDLGAILAAGGRKPEAEQTFQRLAGLGDKTYRHVHAVFLFQEHRREEAIREFEELVAGDPDDRVARTRLITAYQAANRIGDAQRVLESALKKNPKDLDALLQRGELLLGARKLDQAQADFNQVLHLKPDSPEAHYVMARLHQARGVSLNYRQEMSEALRLNPYLMPARIELARSLIGSNAAKAAVNLLNEAPGSQKKSLAILVERNWAYWATGELAEMRKGIDDGLAFAKSPDLLVQDGMWKLRSGDAAGGRASLEAGLSQNPGDTRALAALSDSYVLTKQPAIALQKVKEYAARRPDSASVQQLLGTALWGRGDLVAARAAFTAAKEADPSSTSADLSLAQLDVTERKWDDARSRLTQILAKGEDATAHLWLGNLEEYRGNRRVALAHFTRTVELEPNNAEALNNLAYVLADYANQPDEALKYAEKAQEIAPDRPAISDTLGWILYRKGVYLMALKHLERAAAKSDANPVWKYHLAMAYTKAGNPKQGRAVLEGALKLNPNVPEAKMARELLDYK